MALTRDFKDTVASRVLHDLNGSSAKPAGLDLDVGRLQAIGSTNILEVVGLGLATLRHDEYSVVAGTLT